MSKGHNEVIANKNVEIFSMLGTKKVQTEVIVLTYKIVDTSGSTNRFPLMLTRNKQQIIRDFVW